MTTSPSTRADRDVRLDAGPVRVREAGDPDAPAVLFLHGWPQTSLAWDAVMRAAADDGFHAVAPDLPGVGGSQDAGTDGSTEALASVVDDLAAALGLAPYVLVGHDLGGMVTYAHLRGRRAGPSRAVIMDTVVPGVEPWSQVIADPWVWHFAFQAIPQLPETLVQGRERAYFDFFFDALSPGTPGVSDAARDAYAAAYATPGALSAGFDWYRMLSRDAETNAARRVTVRTPVLYLRGEHSGGDLDDYLRGFRDSGLEDVRGATVAGAGHFSPDDAPGPVWSEIAAFLRDTPA